MSIFKFKLNRNQKRQLKKGELRNIDVDLISLLFDDMKPANGRGAVVKSDGKNMVSKGSSVKFKAEEKDGEGYLYVTVYEPDVKDSQGDIASADEIRKACERFSKKGMLRKNDVNHNMNPVDDCYISENYILKTADPEHYSDTKVGAWVQVIKFDNLQSELWQKAKNNKFNGVSLFGYADDSATQKNELETMKNELTKAIESLKAKNDDKMKPAIDELQSQLNDLDSKMSKSATDENVKTLEKSFNEMLTKLNKAINTSISGEKTEEVKEKMARIGNMKVVVKAEKKELYKAFANVYNGDKTNILTDNLGTQFIDAVVDMNEDDVFTDISVVELGKDESIDKGLLADLVLKNSEDGSPTAQAVPELDIDCPTEILCGDISLSEDTVEFYKDKYGEEAFLAFIETSLSSKAKKALKKLMWNGDRTSSTASLKGLDGLITQVVTATDDVDVDKSDLLKYSERFAFALTKFSNDVLSEKESMVIYVSPKTELAIRSEFAARATNAGDGFLLENSKLSYQGIPIKARQMTDGYYVIGLPKFILLGYRTDVKVKVEHKGSEWKWHWYVRVRFGVTYVGSDYVKVFTEVA